MRDLDLSFVGGVPAWAGFLLLFPAVMLVLWAYRRDREHLRPLEARLLPALRIALLALLLGCLVEPVVSYNAGSEEEAPVAVLVDTSKSMSIRDAQDGMTRLQSVLAPWQGPEAMARRLERRVAVRYFAFDGSTRPLEEARDLADLQPTGEMTLISEALASARGQTGTQAFTGFVLLTDGASQSTGAAAARAAQLGAPVYAVAVGGVVAAKELAADVAIAEISAERFMSLNAENEIGVSLTQRGFDHQDLTVELLEEEQVLDSTVLTLTDGAMEAMLRYVPDRLGKHNLVIRARPFPGEEIQENNWRGLTVLVEKRHLSVIYIEGTPRWEYKFVKRTLEADPAVRFTGFIRGRSDLFVRQGGGEEDGAFPSTAEEFAQYDTAIIGDIAPSFFTADHFVALRDAVIDHGLGVLLIPGANTLRDGGFGETALSDVLPCWPGGDANRAAPSGYQIELSAEGRNHPVFAGLESDLSAGRVPGLTNYVLLSDAGRGANVLARLPAGSGRDGGKALCVAQRAGKGRSMSLAFDTTWHWQMGPTASAGTRALHTRFWGQAVRWLADRQDDTSKEMPFVAYASRDQYDPNEPVILYARLYTPAEASGSIVEPQVLATVRKPAGELLTTPLSLIAGSGGTYKATLNLDAPGAYVAEVTCRRGDESLGEDSARFFIGKTYGEFDVVAMDEQLLRALAFETGGAFYTADSTERLLDDLAEAAARHGLFVEHGLAQSKTAYIALVVLASLEWFVRKRRGLM